MTNWGIIGLGKIAHKFAKDLLLLEDARLYAVASRSQERSQAFADQYNVPHCYDRYEDLMQCAGLDVIYIATPHTAHFENTMLCLQNGKAVLCEKPFAMNVREVQEMVNTARRTDTFLMEAMWTRFMPTIHKMLEIIQKGEIGEVIAVKADFGFHAPFDPASRIYNPALGGGSLLDIGIYPVFLAQLLFGKPSKISALANFGATGVDEDLGMILQYENGKLAHLHSSVIAKTQTEAFIYGTEGFIHLHPRWHEPTFMTLQRYGEPAQDFTFDYRGNGYYLEALEVMDCLQKGKKESDQLPLSFSLELMETLDRIRQEIGLKYPQDEWTAETKRLQF